MLIDTIVDERGAVLAVDVRSFRKERSRIVEHGGHRLALLASMDGAVRVYDVDDLTLYPGDRPDAWVDRHGRVWIAEDDRLRSAEPGSPSRPRVPSHRAFWFGVVAQYADVRLITRE